MRNIVLELEYDGTRYDGWAKQKGSTKAMTIQDKLEAVISKMEDKETEVIGAARTEAGVHAYAQIANFKTDSRKSLLEIEQYINRYLPKDIAVLRAKEADERFHAAFGAKSFEYEYKITMGEVPSVFDRRFNYYSFKKLDIAKMKKACEQLVGTHDLKAFSDNRKQKKSTVRRIIEADVYAQGDEVSISIKADDFWPNMARIIVGTLVAVGKGEIRYDSIKDIIDSGDRERAGETIDPKGLFLAAVNYDN